MPSLSASMGGDGVAAEPGGLSLVRARSGRTV